MGKPDKVTLKEELPFQTVDITDGAFCLNEQCARQGYCEKFITRAALSILKMDKNSVILIANFDSFECQFYVAKH